MVLSKRVKAALSRIAEECTEKVASQSRPVIRNTQLCEGYSKVLRQRQSSLVCETQVRMVGRGGSGSQPAQGYYLNTDQ